MSCFVVPDFHINALVSWAIEHDIHLERHSRATGAIMLAMANRRAYQERYQDPGTPSTYRGFFQVDVDHLGPVDIVKACDCLDYQASDWTRWSTSYARDFLAAIRQEASQLAAGDHQVQVRESRHLPGYDAAAWCLDNERAAA